MTTEIPAPFRGTQPQLLILDVDGVLTANHIWLDGTGTEWKCFFVPDGTGLKLIQLAGVKTALLSGRKSEVVHRRAEEMGIDWHQSGIHDKETAVRQICDELEVDAANAVYVGDDLIDIPAMRIVGLPVAVANAQPDVVEAACAVTTVGGGEGAVREVCEWILKARGDWDEAKKRYLQ